MQWFVETAYFLITEETEGHSPLCAGCFRRLARDEVLMDKFQLDMEKLPIITSVSITFAQIGVSLIIALVAIVLRQDWKPWLWALLVGNSTSLLGGGSLSIFTSDLGASVLTSMYLKVIVSKLIPVAAFVIGIVIGDNALLVALNLLGIIAVLGEVALGMPLSGRKYTVLNFMSRRMRTSSQSFLSSSVESLSILALLVWMLVSLVTRGYSLTWSLNYILTTVNMPLVILSMLLMGVAFLSLFSEPFFRREDLHRARFMAPAVTLVVAWFALGGVGSVVISSSLTNTPNLFVSLRVTLFSVFFLAMLNLYYKTTGLMLREFLTFWKLKRVEFARDVIISIAFLICEQMLNPVAKPPWVQTLFFAPLLWGLSLFSLLSLILPPLTELFVERVSQLGAGRQPGEGGKAQ